MNKQNRLEDYITPLGLESDFHEYPTSYKMQGYAATTQLAEGVSAVRLAMSVKAQDKSMNIKAEAGIVMTGMTVPLADKTTTCHMPHDGHIIDIVWISNNKSLIMYKKKCGEHSGFYLTNYIKTYEKFGFPLDLTEDGKNIKVGKFYKAGTVFAESDQVSTGSLSFTVNLVGMGATLNQTGEDSIILSESACKKLTTITYTDIIMDVTKEDILLNLYGDEDNYTPIPEVGTEIRGDLAVIGKRNIGNSMLMPALLDNNSLREFDEVYDTVMYGTPGTVVDVEILSTIRNGFPNIENLDGMINDSIGCHKSIVAKISSYPKVDTELMKIARVSKLAVNGKKLKFQTKVVNLRIKITVAKEVVPDINSKVSGIFGNKGIVCGIYPDSDMPEGVDYLYEAASVGNRNNQPVLTIGGLATICRQIRNLIRDRVGPDVNARRMFPEDKEFIREYVCDFLKIALSPLYEPYLNASEKEFDEVIDEILEDEFRILLPAPKVSKLIGFEAIRVSKYALLRHPVKLRLTGDHDVVLADEASYTVREILLQNKMGDRVMSATTPFESHFELATSLTAANKHKRQHNYSAVKITGAAELRTMLSYTDQEAIMEIVELGKSPAVRNFAYGTILRSDNPSNIEKVVDRNQIPFSQDPYSLLYESVTQCVGYIPSYESGGYAENDKLDPEFVNKNWDFEGKFNV